MSESMRPHLVASVLLLAAAPAFPQTSTKAEVIEQKRVEEAAQTPEKDKDEKKGEVISLDMFRKK